MGKLHKIRKAVLANPKIFKRLSYGNICLGNYGAWFDASTQTWKPTRWWGSSYRNFVRKVLKDMAE